MPTSPGLRVAFQGERGAYSETALRRRYGDQAEPVPSRTLEEAFAAVPQDRADRVVVPIENATAGSINETYDRLLETDLAIEAEIVVEVRHCLLACPGVERSDLERVLSHPQALAQCEGTLDELGLERVATWDTAGSARRVAQQQPADTAAIASRLAGELHGLEVLATDIQDRPWNRTRFLALGTEGTEPGEGPHRTSLVLSTDHTPGALYRALEPFAKRGVNLSKLESRPTRERPWEYRFYLDLEGHRRDEAVQAALGELEEQVPFLEVLGSFPTDPLDAKPE